MLFRSPELFLLRNLLLRDDSIGWPPVLAPEDWAPCEYDRDGEGTVGVDDWTVGLNVTVRFAFGFAGVWLPGIEEIRGVVSVELDAIVTNASCFPLLRLFSYFLHAALELRQVTMAGIEVRQGHRVGQVKAC